MATSKLACVQMRSGRDPSTNRDEVVQRVTEAADAGAVFVQTPEMTSLVEARAQAPVREHPSPRKTTSPFAALRETAGARGITLQIGSLAVRDGDKVANRAFLIDEGEMELPETRRARSRRNTTRFISLDVDLPNGETWREFAHLCRR